jgi:hypothetical protein
VTRRRRVLWAGLGVSLAAALPARVQQKWSQAEAAYQDRPKDIQSCGLCTRFRPPAACEIVEGEISRNGWCRFFDMVD